MQAHWNNPFEYFDAIYLINLKSREDRLNQAEKEFQKVGIQRVSLVEGIVHENPATGCHLSHAKCFENAIVSGYDRVLIFEDDVEFFPDAYDNLALALVNLPVEWEMFYLGANLDRYKAYQVNEHIARIDGAYATHAYAIRRPLFKLLYEINSDISTVHNDVRYTEQVHPNHACYLSLPLIAGQRDSYSDIQKTVMSSNKIFLSRLDTNLVRIPDG